MDPSRESLWVPLLERVQLPWCGIDAVLHVGGQVPLQEAAVECLAWLERELRKPKRRCLNGPDAAAATEALRRKVRKRFQQHYHVSWNLPHVRELLASVSNWFHPTQADVAPFLRSGQVVEADSAMAIVLDVAKQVVAEYQLALLHHDENSGSEPSDASPSTGAVASGVADESSSAPSAAASKAPDTAPAAAPVDAMTRRADSKTPRLTSPPPETPPDASDPSSTKRVFIEHGEIGFFFCDMRSAAPSDVITCNGRLATPLKAQEHAIVNDAQWRQLEVRHCVCVLRRYLCAAIVID